MKRILFVAGVLLLLCKGYAHTASTDSIASEPVLNIHADARGDWQLTRHSAHTDQSNTGFEGKYLMVSLNGEIVPGLQYNWRQRFNKFSKDSNFFDATDLLYISYKRGWFGISAGKEVVGIGGWEYDANPLNIFNGSIFWNNISCYQWGVGASADISNGGTLTLQVTQSPFFTPQNRNLYSYNILWNSTYGCYSPLFSTNLIEYEKGKYINYIALGNKFLIDKAELEIDLMNRAAAHQTFLMKDFSIMARAAYNFNRHWRINGSFLYDYNNTGNNADYTVYSGTNLKQAGIYAEYYPIKQSRTDLRIHAGCWYAWGENSNTADLMQHNTLFISTGLTWTMDIFTLRK